MAEDLNSILNAYLDGRLSQAQRAKVEARLKTPSVARKLEGLRRVRAAVREALPQPSQEQSRRMWASIQGQLGPAAADARLPEQAPLVSPSLDPSPAEPWHAFFTRPWMRPVWGMGLAGAALVLVLFLNPRMSTRVAPPPVAPSSQISAGTGAPASLASENSSRTAQISARTQEPVEAEPGPAAVLAEAPKPKETPAESEPLPTEAAAAPAVAALPAAVSPPSAAGPTEVELALADNKVDDMIDQFMTVRQPRSVPAVVDMEPSPQAQSPSLGFSGADVDYQQAAVPVQPADADGPAGRVQGSKDAGGFWNWTPAASALNQRNWPQARVELQAAQNKASEAAERAFADSALTLLSAPGGPLEAALPALPPVGDLRVLSAGTWQLLVDSKLARFGGGVSVRLPGLREDGDSFLLDLTFDRGEFAPGAHFVRVSGEAPVKVIDSAKQPVSADDFYAPNGADYDISDHELRLR
ncbi:MAG TPA: hypothetical protein VK914_01460 [bacterium]|jgi:hypothetical protein|nr:hypothetical protein [bacterium]